MGMSAYLEFRTQTSRTGALQRRLVSEPSLSDINLRLSRAYAYGYRYTLPQPNMRIHTCTPHSCTEMGGEKESLLPSLCNTLPIASTPVCLARIYDILSALEVLASIP